MNLKKKMDKIFDSGYLISFQNEVKRKDGEWHSRIVWKHLQPPMNQIIEDCEWFGFEDIEECVDDCLKYINSK